MTWVRLDDGFVRHPRMVAAGLHGRALFIAGLCYCGAHLTDGRIPKAVLPVLAAEAGVKPSTWKKLVEVGSWVDHGDHLEVHDYLVYNPARSKVVADREAGAERQRRSRESRQKSRSESQRDRTVTNGVTSRDPSHPIPSPKPPSSSTGSSKEPPGNGADAPDDDLWDELAHRRAQLEHPDGQGIDRPDQYHAALVNDHRNRLGARSRLLRSQHPNWTTSDLADELDPDTAPRLGNAMTAEETDDYRVELDAHKAAAVPMPADTRRAVRR